MRYFLAQTNLAILNLPGFQMHLRRWDLKDHDLNTMHWKQAGYPTKAAKYCLDLVSPCLAGVKTLIPYIAMT